jgi:hypothetical protein
MPQSALVSPEPSSTAIPLKLPDNASNITVVKIGKTQAIVFTVPAPFGLHSLGPSFSERPLATRNGTEACLLQKGAVKWMAVMDKTGPQNRVSLMELTSH